jgi:hypothetical protein
MSRVRRARRTTKRARKAAASGYVAPVRTRQGVTFIVDEASQLDALRGSLGELALDTREQYAKRVR